MPKLIDTTTNKEIIDAIVNKGASVKEIISKRKVSSSYVYSLLKRQGYDVTQVVPERDEELSRRHKERLDELIALAKTKLPYTTGYWNYITAKACPHLTEYQRFEGKHAPTKRSNAMFDACMEYLHTLPPLEVTINDIISTQKLLMDYKKYKPIDYGCIASYEYLSIPKLERFLEKSVKNITISVVKTNEMIKQAINEIEGVNNDQTKY